MAKQKFTRKVLHDIITTALVRRLIEMNRPRFVCFHEFSRTKSIRFVLDPRSGGNFAQARPQ